MPQVYTIYSILFIVFIILIIVTAFITVALTYFQLAVEVGAGDGRAWGCKVCACPTHPAFWQDRC